jgi:GT2 family glycosyltransferase
MTTRRAADVKAIATGTIDIVIVNYRCVDDTLAAVAALLPWQPGCLWVVDNSEDDGEVRQLAAALADRADARLLVPERNLGFGGGCNLAFEQSRAEFFLLLNPDALIDKRNIDLLVAALQDDPRLAAVSPKVFWDPEQRFLLPSAFTSTPALLLAMMLGQRFPRLARLAAHAYLRRMRTRMAAQRPFQVAFLVGAVMLVRRRAAIAAGGLFDPAYFMFYEDSDLSLRLRNAGYRLAVAPAAAAVHEYRHKPFKAGMMADSEQIYFARHFPLFYRLTNGLARLSRLARPVCLQEWGEVLPAPIANPQALQKALGDAGILAISPSFMMMPAIFRPAGAAPAQLSNDDWQRLEPGRYMLICSKPAGDAQLRWISFEHAGSTAHDEADMATDGYTEGGGMRHES